MFSLLQTAVILQRAHDVTIARSYDLAKARDQIQNMEESTVTLEVHSQLQKECDDYKSRVQELELQLVLEESKVTAAVLAKENLRNELEEKVRVAQEAETQAKVEETFLANKVTQLTSDLTEMRGKVESAEARVKAAEEEMEGVATEALYLAWTYNRLMDLSFLGDPSMLARFETKLAAEESAAAQAQKAASEGKVPELDPVVEIEAEVPSDAP